MNPKKRIYIMGVVNCTPDSFSDGGLYCKADKAISHAMKLAEEGADILDIGGESTRPFSEPVEVSEELRRVVPVVKELRRQTDCIISVDTQKAEVARAVLEEGADIINDISALRFDPNMAEVIKGYHTPVCLMHMKGTPRDMQRDPEYEDCAKEVFEFLEERLRFLESLGLSRKMAIVDPGIGFGKRLQHNLELLANLHRFKALGCMVLVGVSRKSFLGEITGIERPSDRDVPTLGAVAWSVMNGADIVRVHNVRWTCQVLSVLHEIMAQKAGEG